MNALPWLVCFAAYASFMVVLLQASHVPALPEPSSPWFCAFLKKLSSSPYTRLSFDRSAKSLGLNAEASTRFANLDFPIFALPAKQRVFDAAKRTTQTRTVITRFAVNRTATQAPRLGFDVGFNQSCSVLYRFSESLELIG